MKAIPVADSVGMVLSHDLTKIVSGKFKGPAFKKGHVIQPEDIPVLLSMGKDHIYIWEPPEGHIHENDAAYRIAKTVIGNGIVHTEPHEGKISFKADYDGLFKVNKNAINRINSILNMCFSTLHNNFPVNQGKTVAATRVIPLTIEEKAVIEVESLAREYEWIIKVTKFKPLKIGAVITGNEVYYKRIEDAFGPALKKKLDSFGYSIEEQIYMPDDINRITDTILQLKENGKELILVAGGMSVDPDDRTPGAIKNTGASIITYGSPVLPGAMFMAAELEGTIILGLPACVIYSPSTILDIVLPRILAGELINREDIIQLGVGGLCQNCEICFYPNCGFGKG
ncbi:Probable molybdopterin binding domain-containing protein [Desulfotomaculum arcticum]|uniref:Molybdopterin molybdenumtransferase n=1 Tax=Desulfotruncus arcticus DSM 17038 TaxID=1121424 RepID=A0A1I2S4T5_9FIRM|nr:molybdopterin-binding protein [Desulfotruncus arcticus]SFG47323.1 Probable molybdopterin binding domain-containing protein [Desulfotomaculum arcticum] [Desulfotruncus arcticus DSM 17038]